MTSTIHAFTKPDCPYCAKAKAALDAAGLAYAQHDVTASERMAHASVYFSGAGTVPQVFLGDLPVGGSTEVAALAEAGRLVATAGVARDDLPLGALSDEALARGAEDLPLREVIPESDGTRDPDPEQWAILRMYKEFFGFWPNCFYYQHHWPEAYKSFVYDHNAGAIRMGRETLGAPVMNALGYATSNAHGCSYCQIHSASVGGEASQGFVAQIEAARAGEGDAGPFGPFEAALADLVAAVSTNTVTDERLDKVRRLAGEARVSEEGVEANLAGAAMIASAFGFLNVFNDLTGVKVEAEWASASEAGAGIDAERHGVSEDRASTNLDFDLPEGGPSLGEMIADHAAVVVRAGGPEAYAEREVGLAPSWLRAWPEPLRSNHAYFYAEVMAEQPHSLVPAELKHLMARVSHIAKGHDALAAAEGLMAHRAGEGTDRALERVRTCCDAARERDEAAPFDEAERAALRLARLSARTPLITPRRFVEPAVEAFGPAALVQLITVCAMASLVQRFAAIARPAMEPETEAFLVEHGIEVDTLALRFPLAVARDAAA